MKQLRKENLSLYRYIKDVVLRSFIEKDELVPLSPLHNISSDDSYVYQANSNTVPSPIDRGRGWVFFDCLNYDTNGDCVYSDSITTSEFVTVTGTDAQGTLCIGTPEQSNRVVVYDENFVTISDVYLIDYVDGRIIFNTNAVVPKYVDYYWNYVSVIEGWSSLNAVKPPIVVIDHISSSITGYQFGAGRKTTRKVDIHIFASSTAERSDIESVIIDGLYLKSFPVYDFSTGDVLDFDGTFYGRKENNNKLTSLFNRTTLDDLEVLHGGMMFNNVVSNHIKIPLLMSSDRNEDMLSDLNAYRSKVSFEIETYSRK